MGIKCFLFVFHPHHLMIHLSGHGGSGLRVRMRVCVCVRARACTCVCVCCRMCARAYGTASRRLWSRRL